MKMRLNCMLSGIIFLFCSGRLQARSNPSYASGKLFFIENKGQIKDQYGCPRNDIQYALAAPGINVFIGNAQLHYQFSRITSKDRCIQQKTGRNCDNRMDNIQSSNVETYRMDVELVNANKQAEVIVTEPQAYYENYYLPGCHATGIQAHTYKRITYKNVYPHIDWVVYVKGDKLEHEFVVGPGGDASLIKLKYGGQASLKISEDGSITATTPMGTIREQAPVCYSLYGGFPVSAGTSKFTLSGSILSYDVNGYKGGLVIDPVVEWGTYYGPDTNASPFFDVACDNAGNIYACGYTYSGVKDIATSGSYQDSIGSTMGNAYLVKFDTSGNRLWGTYYGGSGINFGSAVACDPAGNVYLAGRTSSADSIATPGSHQPAIGAVGAFNGFLVKFNASGVRSWATYYGGDANDQVYSVNCDTLGHVYIAGIATSSFNIATAGAFETTGGAESGFLVQFDTAGVRQWGTYYNGYAVGAPTNVYAVVNCNDGRNVYLSGWTSATDSITTPGSWKPDFGSGTSHVFLVKFDNLGNRLWGTFYGGEGSEESGGIACDKDGYVYLLGNTFSDSGIASPGSFQATRGGSSDAFLVKFEPVAGMRVWGTYYGGPGNETDNFCTIVADDSDNAYIVGLTNSTTGIASANAWQTTYGGGANDAFFAKYDSSGKQVWSSYYGGNGDDEASACAFDGLNPYICGETNSTNNIATPGAFEPAGGGDVLYYQGFLAKIVIPDYLILSTGMTQMGSADIHVFPVPNNGTFTLTAGLQHTNGTAAIIITDAAGKVILNDNATIINGTVNKQICLNNNTPCGEYLLKLVSQGETGTIKFVKD